jgi:galactokinase
MDQIAAFGGTAGHALLLDCRSGKQTPVPLELAAAGLALLVIDTRARHVLGDGQYGSRRQACEQAAALLGVRSLRDVTGDPDAPARLADPSLRRVCGHVIAENRRVLRAAELLRAGELHSAGGQASIGELLTASHRSLREEFAVSWPQADEAVDAAIEAGALGARMTGGGFGGSVIALVPADCLGQVRTVVTRRFATHQWPAPRYLDAVPSAGARRVSSRV